MNINQDEVELVIPKSIIGFLQRVITVAILSDEVSLLQEKIHKCRHNEIVAFLVCIIGVGLILFGVIFFQLIGGLRIISFVMGILLASVSFVMNVNYHMKRAIYQKILNETKK
jgi:hypothetical protein